MTQFLLNQFLVHVSVLVYLFPHRRDSIASVTIPSLPGNVTHFVYRFCPMGQYQLQVAAVNNYSAIGDYSGEVSFEIAAEECAGKHTSPLSVLSVQNFVVLYVNCTLLYCYLPARWSTIKAMYSTSNVHTTNAHTSL